MTTEPTLSNTYLDEVITEQAAVERELKQQPLRAAPMLAGAPAAPAKLLRGRQAPGEQADLLPGAPSPRAIDCAIDVKVMLTNRGVRPRPRARRSAISTSKPIIRSGFAGSASTYGAPPSASAPQRSGVWGAESAPGVTAKNAKNAKK